MSFKKARLALLLAGLIVFFGLHEGPRILSSEQIIELVNQDRAKHGLDELEISPVLNLAALAKAQDMLEQNYFSHYSPQGVDPWHWFKALGYQYTYAGENLAEGFSDAGELEKSWMSSPSHRANILSPYYSDIGLAVIRHNNKNIVVQLFGSKETKLTIRN